MNGNLQPTAKAPAVVRLLTLENAIDEISKFGRLTIFKYEYLAGWCAYVKFAVGPDGNAKICADGETPTEAVNKLLTRIREWLNSAEKRQ